MTPESSTHPPSLPRTLLLAVLGAGLVTLGARASFPAEPVPITLQTAAVLTVGGVFGARVGVLAALLYVGAAAAGLGVLAGGAHLDVTRLGESKSLGFLVGFAPAAWVASRACPADGGTPRRSTLPAVGRALAAMLAAHGVILVLGGGWLALSIGASAALEHGVLPYMPGALVKSVLAGAVTLAVRRR
ncbi:MAG: biotin transporter BioY [Planctomycetota bacterium]